MKKRVVAIILLLMVVLTTFASVGYAAPATITVRGGKAYGKLIGGTYWNKKTTDDGTILYCLEHYKSTPYNETFKFLEYMDAGYTYIIANGYPYKSFTGNADYDHYITQGAIHWYTDRINGVSDNQKGQLTANFKTSASDPHNLRPQMKALMEQALNARNQGFVNPTGSISVGNTSLSLTSDHKYFISSPIKLSTTGTIKSLNVSLVSGPTGTIFVDQNGNTKTSFNSGDVFYVKVPVSSLTGLTAEVKVSMSGQGSVIKVAKYVQATNVHGDVQDLIYARPEEIVTNFGNGLTFNLTTTKVEISKVDITSEKELPGATLEIKDAKGKVIETWVSTDKKHVINHLPAGKYTLTETIAPDGYVRATDVEFEVKADGTVQSVTMVDDYTKLEISKQDVTNKKELSGAKLKLYNEEGEVIAEWTSSDKPYYLEKLKVGKYKLVEEVAPEGYVLAREAVEFEVLETGDIQTAVMFNTPLTPTPDTAFHPSTMLYIGAVILGCFGIGLVYWNAKKHS